MVIEKNKRYLLICESPNKVKSITQILKALGHTNVVVMASVGHITHIADTGEFNMGIDVKNNFKADYKIAQGKQDVVKKLREQVKFADAVILATDGDREGEAIAYHLAEELKIPAAKQNRITYHEITKPAIEKAIRESRQIDYDLVAAAVSREKADKIIGYRLSGIARNSVGARSVGRCQSAGLKLLVMREEEIQNFKSEKYFDLYLHFTKNASEFKAKYIGTAKKAVKSLKSLAACKQIAADCANQSYTILDITKKDSLENPKPPFITSTFQQEVSKRLGISVKHAMDCAQKLFEGIDIGGKHVSLITYIRTDSTDISEEFQTEAKDFIDSINSSLYKGKRAVKNSQLAQEGHECIRPVDVNLTPEKLNQLIDNEQLVKIYKLIWERAVGSLCKPALIENKVITIENSGHLFTTTFKRIKDKGYKEIIS